MGVGLGVGIGVGLGVGLDRGGVSGLRDAVVLGGVEILSILCARVGLETSPSNETMTVSATAVASNIIERFLLGRLIAIFFISYYTTYILTT